jgi:hypothetical protein
MAQNFGVGFRRPCLGQTGPLFRPKTAKSSKSLTSPAVKKLGVGVWRPCRGQTFGGMHGALARNIFPF